MSAGASWIDVDGLRLHIEQTGSGPPLFLLHGLGSGAWDWEYQVPELARHFRVIAPDFRGHGRSEGRGPYRIATWAADTLAIADRLGIERFSMLGYSMGGAVAQQIALDAPRRVRRLALSNTLPSFRPRGLRQYLMLCWRLVITTVLSPPQLARFVAGRLFPRPEQRALRDKVALRNAGNDPAVYFASICALARWSVIERLPELVAPTYVLAAEHDYFSTAYLREFVTALPNCAGWHVFPGTRHGLPLEAPEAFNAKLLEFLLRP